MSTLTLVQPVRAYRRMPASFVKENEGQLLAAMFPLSGIAPTNLLMGVTDAGTILYRDMDAYLDGTTATSRAAARTANDRMVELVLATRAAVTAGNLPEAFLTLFEGLKADAPVKAIAATEEGEAHYYQVFYRPYLPASAHEFEDEFLKTKRKQHLKGLVEEEWISVDVGADNRVIGLTIQRRPLSDETILSKPMEGLPGSNAPVIVFSPRENDEVLHPYLDDPELGLFPLSAVDPDLKDAEGLPSNAFGRRMFPGLASENRFLPISELLVRMDKAEQEANEPVLLASLDGFGGGDFYTKRPSKDDIWPGQRLRVTRDDVGFHKRDLGQLRRGQKPPADSYIYPSLMKGEVLQVEELTPSGWIHVIRVKDGVKGYVDWRYVEDIVIDLPEFTIRALTDASAKRLADHICSFIRKKLVPPTMLDRLRNIYNMEIDIALNTYVFKEYVYIDTILQIMQQIERHYTLESFALLCIKLRKKGCLQKIIAAFNASHLGQYWQLILKVCYMMPLESVTDLMETIVAQSLAKALHPKNITKQIWKQRKTILRYPTWNKWNPLDKDAIRQEIAKAVNSVIANQDMLIQVFTDNLEILLRMKYYDLYYHVKRGDDAEVKRLVVEMDVLADAGLELLFSTDPQNNYLQLPVDLTLVDLWNLLSAQRDVPTIFLLQDGTKTYSVEKETAPTMKEIFCDERKTLLTSLPTPVVPQLSGPDKVAYDAAVAACRGGGSSPASTASTSTTNQPLINKTAFTDLAKRLVKMSAERMYAFLTSDLYAFYVQYPTFLPMINHVYLKTLRPAAAERLTLDKKYKKKFANQRVANKDLTAAIINKTPEIIDRLKWIDIARIWYYELGSQSQLGQEGHELTFNIHSKTTTELRGHPGMKRILEYMKARVAAGNYDEVLLQVKYDTNGFWKSIVANDVVFNLLGSFAVRIQPSSSNNKGAFTVVNTLSMESASRFKKHEGGGGRSTQIDGLIESKERDAKNALESGGTLRCLWKWSESLA